MERYFLKFILSQDKKRRGLYEGPFSFETKFLCRDKLPKFQYSLREDSLSLFFVLDPKDINKTQPLQRRRQAGSRPGQTGSQRWPLCFIGQFSVVWFSLESYFAVQNDGRAGETEDCIETEWQLGLMMGPKK